MIGRQLHAGCELRKRQVFSEGLPQAVGHPPDLPGSQAVLWHRRCGGKIREFSDQDDAEAECCRVDGNIGRDAGRLNLLQDGSGKPCDLSIALHVQFAKREAASAVVKILL
jgi:hypothetical protein